jgi:hypothetical protein
MKMHVIRLVFICMTIISLMLTGCGGSSTAPASATPPTQATVIPPPPTGVTATGGTAQAVIRWDAAPGATSYNVYELKSGTNPPVWTKFAGAPSPFVRTGLAAGAMYNYIVTAVNSVGESSPSSQVFAWTDSLASAPATVIATGGAGQVTLTWDPVPEATSYNLYWSTTPGILIMVKDVTGAVPLPITPIKIANVTSSLTSPYVWTGTGDNFSGGSINPPPPLNLHFDPTLPTFVVTPNTTYYFVVTAVTSAGEVPSQEVSATTLSL